MTVVAVSTFAHAVSDSWAHTHSTTAVTIAVARAETRAKTRSKAATVARAHSLRRDRQSEAGAQSVDLGLDVIDLCLGQLRLHVILAVSLQLLHSDAQDASDDRIGLRAELVFSSPGSCALGLQ
ncbi:MAG: hypothetical protein RL745_758, partial [Actinomycetota bacterium]